LLSTWPAASGVLVEDGVAYVAAGIVNYDGTYVYALDAATGRVKWQNNTSGHLQQDARTGVSVQGHLLLNGGKLYLAGGNAVSPAIYDAANGRCLNNPEELRQLVQNNLVTSQSPRGWELFLLADRVDKNLLDKVNWARLSIKQKPLWSYDCKGSVALAVCSNAVVVAEALHRTPSGGGTNDEGRVTSVHRLVALNLKDGRVLGSQPVPSAPVPWGLAVDRNGRIIVSLEDGQVLCYGQKVVAYSQGGPQG